MDRTTIITPHIIPRAEHTLSRAQVSEYALKVLYRLKEAGYEGYLVGGCVRDLLLGREPKDFDVATNASPDQVAHLFRNCRLIGRRFRLAHVHFGRDIIEVATFRGAHAENEGEAHSENGRILRDNVYGTTLEDDAWRRDFTVNALYYNIRDFSVVDCMSGMDDLRAGLLRLVGEPEQRYREDAVRMLRAVRFAAKLGFRIHPESEVPMTRLGHLLSEIPSARLFEEVLKLFMGGYAVQTFELLRHYRLFGHLFPDTEASLTRQRAHFPLTLLTHALGNTDERIAQGKPVTPAFLFAALLWEPMRQLAEKKQAEGMSEIDAMQLAAETVVMRQVTRIALPKRFSVPMREIWAMQYRLPQRAGKRALRLLAHPRFRAAYDFLLLRAAAGEEVQELADWWTHFQETDGSGQQTLLGTLVPSPAKKRRRRRAPRGRSAGQAAPE
ncbi:MAG: polynucleotide adenylyltransferase PcnB [Proteobacteria bacterium]|nr:polynucleotide adenylyltransferase PcnB [Pseudomonadota bacterium]